MTKSTITDNLTSNFKAVNKRGQQSKPTKAASLLKPKGNQTTLPFAKKGSTTPANSAAKTLQGRKEKNSTPQPMDNHLEESEEEERAMDTDEFSKEEESGNNSDSSTTTSSGSNSTAYTNNTEKSVRKEDINIPSMKLNPQEKAAADATKNINKQRRAEILREEEEYIREKYPHLRDVSTLDESKQESMVSTETEVTPRGTTTVTPPNPYKKPPTKETQQNSLIQQRPYNGTGFHAPPVDPLTSTVFSPQATSAQAQTNSASGIRLKNQQQRQYIHRFDLRLKIKSADSDEASQKMIQKALSLFFNTVLQADATTLIPPYLKLDREASGIYDLSGRNTVADLKGFTTLKRYFSNLFPKAEGGQVYCRVILALSGTVDNLITKIRPSLQQYEMGLWQRPTDCEQVSDIGWLLYSTRNQDEHRLASLLSSLIGEPIGVRWRPVRTTSKYQKQTAANAANVVRALHLEGDSSRVHLLKHKIATYYGTSSKQFPDGTRMRLIPPFNSVISADSKSKYGAVVARQAAFLTRLASQQTWELSSNLVLDRKNQQSNQSLRQVLLNIKSSRFPGTSLFHTIDKSWGTESGITFTFVPENEEEARMYITGLVPFIRDTTNDWYLSFFSADAISRYSDAAWDPTTNQLASTSDVWVNGSLVVDGDLNGAPTDNTNQSIDITNPPTMNSSDIPTILRDDDSISTFQTTTGPPTQNSNTPMTPQTTPQSMTTQALDVAPHTSLPTAMGSITLGTTAMDVSKMSDTESRFSAIESHMKSMADSFTSTLQDLQKQAKDHQENQKAISALLQNLLQQSLRQLPPTDNPGGGGATDSGQSPTHPIQANNLTGMNVAGDPSGVAGHRS